MKSSLLTKELQFAGQKKSNDFNDEFFASCEILQDAKTYCDAI